MKRWQVTFSYISDGDAPEPGQAYGVVERDIVAGEAERTLRTIASGLTRDEAHAVANSRESLDALQILWEAIHREDDEAFDTERVGEELKAAFDVLMRARGVRA